MFLSSWEACKKFSLQLTQSHKRSRIVRYTFPVILLLINNLLSVWFDKIFDGNIPLHLATLIIILSAWYGGLGPGIEATILSQVLNPSSATSTTLGDIISFCLALLVGIFISLVSEAKRQADVQKDEFISVVSHELKNPLTSITVYAELLHKQAIAQKQKQYATYAEKIGSGIQQAKVIMEDMVDLSGIESGKFAYQDEQFQISTLVKEIAAEQQVINQSYSIEVTGSSKKKIYADKKRIRQVLTNLVTNAIKYSPNSSKVKIASHNKKDGVEISVRDYGIGIPKEQLNKVFNRFFRTSNALENKIKGRGLGLHVAQQIIKRHHGKLWVESTFGKGSTFYLFLSINKEAK